MIPGKYFIENDTLWLAKDLLGKYLYSNTDEYGPCAGIITETEAYMGISDRASHAYGNKRTRRTEIMFQPGGVAYIYLCYGIHHLFNIVTSQQDSPHAVLIRAVKPASGIENFSQRLKKKVPLLLNGPGKLTKAMGITTAQNGISLESNKIWLADFKVKVPSNLIQSGPRIGVDYAGEDAMLPYRFLITDTSFLKQYSYDVLS